MSSSAPSEGSPAGERLPRVLVVIGTRPEVIKMAPVVQALRTHAGVVDHRVVLTGQHTTLVDQALRTFDLRADHDLNIMREGQTLYDVAHACLDGMRVVVQAYQPDVVLVQGDTATVFFSSLVAFLENVRVGHVEAGLRSRRKWSPFPEEIFRRLTDVATDFYFAPTEEAGKNLAREGVAAENIYVTGNTVVDAVRSVVQNSTAPENEVLREVSEGGRRMILVTAHRRESFGEPLRRVFGAIREVADRHQDVEIVFPVHPNPKVLGPAHEILGNHRRIHLVEPLSYIDLVHALRRAELILTDSGGIQEEAPTFGTPVLVMREVTERPEGVSAGAATLVGTDPLRIIEAAQEVLARPMRTREAPPANPYGDGRAGERIADILVSELSGSARKTSDWVAP